MFLSDLAEHIFTQSFSLDDIKYWIRNEADFGHQLVYLDGRYDDSVFDHTEPTTWQPSMMQLVCFQIGLQQ